MAELTWHGHACATLVTDDGTRILFDPWLDANPKAEIGAADVGDLDYLLVSHGHFDHFGDGVKIAKATGAMLVAVFELCAFAQSRGIENVHGLNIGGGYRFPFGYVKMTPALHSASIEGDEGAHPSVAGGFWIDLGGKRLYHAGDTALTRDMELLRDRVDVALLPIGDNFTMGPEDAAIAVDLIRPRVVIPIHYDTFPAIEQDPRAFAARVGDRAETVILEPGGSYSF